MKSNVGCLDDRPAWPHGSTRSRHAIVLALVLQLVGSILIDGHSSDPPFARCWCLASLLGALLRSARRWWCFIGGIDLSTPFVIGFANVVQAAQLMATA